MPDTSLDIIEARAVAQIIASPAPTFQLFTGRADDEPLTDGELPGSVLRIVDFDFASMPGEEMSQHLITATFQFDCHSGIVAGQTIDKVNRQTVAWIIARLLADPTLGGRAIDITVRSVSGSELDGADIGTAILEVAIQFCVPRGDLYRIVGMGGTLYTN